MPYAHDRIRTLYELNDEFHITFSIVFVMSRFENKNGETFSGYNIFHTNKRHKIHPHSLKGYTKTIAFHYCIFGYCIHTHRLGIHMGGSSDIIFIDFDWI